MPELPDNPHTKPAILMAGIATKVVSWPCVPTAESRVPRSEFCLPMNMPFRHITDRLWTSAVLLTKQRGRTQANNLSAQLY